MTSRMEKASYKILLAAGSVPKETLDRLLEESEAANASFTELLVKNGVMREAELLEIYSRELGIPCVNLKGVVPDAGLIEKVPVKFASYYKFFPCRLEGKKLTIAVSRLLDVHELDEIKFGLGFDIDAALAPARDVEEMLQRYYGLGAATVDRILTRASPEAAPPKHEAAEEVENIEKLAETASVVQLVNQIILEAYRKRASDIHVEPFRGRFRLRYRIDGFLREAPLAPEMMRFIMPILSRIKIMANLNIVERRLPQDGKARVKTQEQSLDLRISSIPTPHGESVVIRILPSTMILKLEKLGLETRSLKLFQELIKRPHGIIFVTGPTGSGKSTTLYAALNTINIAERKIITIEDPIEYEMQGMTQIQVIPEIGLTFARGLRSMLRHDPDVMMVGEVRDLETADIAIRAALTGHLILSTLHTNDAASGVTRLLDIGVEPYLVASSVIAFMGQRLVRVICPHCREEDKETPEAFKQVMLEELGLERGEAMKLFWGKGCEECSHTGFSGRTAIHEILPVDDEIRNLILERSTSETIMRRARELGMKTLRQDGWRKVLAGITTPEEIIEATPQDEPLGAQTARPAETEPVTRVAAAAGPKYAGAEWLENPAAAFTERRKYHRVKCEMRVTFHLLRTGGNKGSEKVILDAWDLHGHTEDISAGGLVLVTAEPLKPGDVVEMRLPLPDGDKPIECIARVLRVTQKFESLDPTGRVLQHAAMLFLAIQSVDRLRIENFCRESTQNEAV
jgi:type II secretory ATPase GspE/PulE/Tfp pilus assembly ATPase PilB-like protein